MLAMVLWLERLADRGPPPDDDEVGTLGRVHTDGSALVLYEVEPTRSSTIRIRSVMDLDSM